LIQFESLLSTQGDEKGMLGKNFKTFCYSGLVIAIHSLSKGDMDVAVKKLCQVYFKLLQSVSSDSSPNGKKEIRITPHPSLMEFYVVEVELPVAMFHQIPSSLQVSCQNEY